MSKVSRDNKKKVSKQLMTSDVPNQNQDHNTQKEALGPNTKR